MNLLLTCQEVLRCAPDYEENQLKPGLRLRMNIHLKACKACRAMMDILQALPKLLRRAMAEDAPAPSPEATKALNAALARIQAGGRGATPSLIDRISAHPMPLSVRTALAQGQADRPMRMLAAAHEAIQARGGALSREPFLPDSVLKDLPALETWKWTKALMNGCSSAQLLKDPDTDSSLHMILLPPGRRFPDHRHRGDEHVLLLAGQAEDTRFYGVAGDWFHQENGTDHSALQGRGDDICWTLTRLEGRGIHLKGWRGAIQSITEKLA